MPQFRAIVFAISAALIFGAAAHAQDNGNAQDNGGGNAIGPAPSNTSNAAADKINPLDTPSAPVSVMTPDPMMTTKKLPFAKASPSTEPMTSPALDPNGKVPDAPSSGKNNAAPSAPTLANTPSPFGKSTAVVDKQFVGGPKSTSAVPVEDVDTIETGEAAPPEPTEAAANPVKEDPALPTELTAPIFTAQASTGVHPTIVRILNKVTARSEKIELKPDTPTQVGKLIITASHCQHSDPSSLPDDAALVSISEVIDAKTPAKQLFTGWLYASSPSINGLEHPIYDISLVSCVGVVQEAKAEIKPQTRKSKN